ncbi:BgtAc-30127 [Blumeria graminis f. sp. tritici]|uniref:BgtAc-30127 n=2 Tax=Blumeria graminis f. sp. tritici TaxID=62690 RepID=A0A9X9PS56_BLUGR|nr:hypothetical protein BGT96224_Ac30127 [Blumeria graminis f. sp. tritici 96224]VCU40706.1 BgtAc-30127 [Blumeria graminis f. sp. tritici]
MELPKLEGDTPEIEVEGPNIIKEIPLIPEISSKSKSPEIGLNTSSKLDLVENSKDNIVSTKNSRNISSDIIHDLFATGNKKVEPDKIHRNELLPPPKNHQKLLQNQYSAVFEAEELKEFSKPFGKESCTQSSKTKLDLVNARRS